MDSVPCEVVMQRLWAFLDGELDAAASEQVREHLEMCTRCYPHYDFQRTYFLMMQRLAERQDSPVLRSRVFQALLLEDA